MTQDPQPLSGIKIVDFTQAMLGPVATQVLADYGADVIKIERQGPGDLSRWSVFGDPEGAKNPVFNSLNRNKRSIALDLKSREGKEIVYELIKTADVVVNNFRPGVMERMGFGHDQLKAMNPRIISAFGSGFGRSGPMSHKGGQDVLAQALSGLMARKSRAEDPVSIYATCLCDYTTGMHLAQAILLALMQREKTGRGQEVAVSLFESMLAMQLSEAAAWLQRRHDLNWGAMPLTGTFATQDGSLVLVGAFKVDPLGDISRALDLPELKSDPRFSNLDAQIANKAELHRLFATRFASNTTSYWLGRLEEQDLLCAPVLTMAEALEHEQTQVNGNIIMSDLEDLHGFGTPLRMDPTAFQVRHSPPALGSDGGSILAELGYGQDRIAALKSAGVVS